MGFGRALGIWSPEGAGSKRSKEARVPESFGEQSSQSENDYGGVEVSEEASRLVLELRSEEADASELALWLEVTGAEGESFLYDIYFAPLADASPSDLVQHFGELPVVVPSSSVAELSGARLDVAGDQLVVMNPNRPDPTKTARIEVPGDLDSDLARRVMAVLEEQVNPAIAMHGGRAELVSVDGTTAYLRLMGGCQGCGLAAITLREGIEVAIRDFVPEIDEVVDVTDHASGTNPFYQAAKK